MDITLRNKCVPKNICWVVHTSILSILKKQNNVPKTASKQIQWEKFMATDSELQFECQVSPHYIPILPSQAPLQLPASPKGVRNPHHLSSSHFDPGGTSPCVPNGATSAPEESVLRGHLLNGATSAPVDNYKKGGISFPLLQV